MVIQAWRQLRRDWRGGELGLLALSLVLAAAMVSGVAGFTGRLHSAMAAESHVFLAADRVLSSPLPVDEAWLSQSEHYGLRRGQMVSFRSMLFAGESMQLVGLRAVSDAYPLLGQIETSPRPYGQTQRGTDGPGVGEIWLDARLFALLDVDVGDAVSVGESSLVASRVLVSTPDQNSGMAGFGPQALMHIDDLDATGVVQPGSLVRYRYLFVGEPDSLAAYGDWLQPRLADRHRWQSVEDSQPAMAETLARAESFLLLAASLGVALAGVAIALSARRFTQRHIDSVAIMKTLGASRRRVLSHFLMQLAYLWGLTLVVGVLLGRLVAWLLLSSIAGLLSRELPSATWQPAVLAAVTTAVCILAFALPPLLALSRVSPMRVIRRDSGMDEVSLLSSASLGMAGIAALMLWFSGSWRLAGAVMLGVVGLGLLAAGMVLMALGVCRRRLAPAVNGWRRLAIAGMYRRRYGNAFQVACFGLAMMAMVTLLVLRTSLVTDWQKQLDPESPNHFLINIAPDEVDDLQQLFAERRVEDAGFYPMVRGRLTHIDQQALSQISGIDADEAGVDREANLSWAEALPEDNSLVSGRWWPELEAASDGRVPVSVEAQLAEQLNLQAGSELDFNIGGQTLTARVTSVRRLEWSSMRPNFFFLFPPNSLENYASSYITSFYLPPSQGDFVTTLIQGFPTVSVIDVGSLIAQMTAIVDKVSRAVAVVAALVTLCALLVTLSNIQVSLDVRRKENALLRAIGAPSGVIRALLLTEFAAIGALAGLIAALGANVSLYGIQLSVLEMTPKWHWAPLLYTPVAGAAVIAALAWFSARRVVRVSPLVALQAPS